MKGSYLPRKKRNILNTKSYEQHPPAQLNTPMDSVQRLDYLPTYPVLSDFIGQPFVEFEVFTARGKCSKVNYKGKWSTI